MVKVEQDAAIRNYIRQFEQIAKFNCAPLFWTDADGNPHNGSMTFVRTPDRIIGLTNRHVADAIELLTPESGITLQLGAARFDPARLIAKHPDLDLASYDISDVLLSVSRHGAASVLKWPIQSPNEDDVLVVGGWPAIYRVSKGDNIDFGFAWVAAKINGRPGRNISLDLRLETGTALSYDAIVPGDDLGGWSGGSVYRYVDTGFIEYIELCGVIYSSDEHSNFVLAHSIESLGMSGEFV